MCKLREKTVENCFLTKLGNYTSKVNESVLVDNQKNEAMSIEKHF
jgi:hypothetical protein